MKDHVREVEKALLIKIDEIHFKADKLAEQLRNREDDSSIDNRSQRVKASVIAAPVMAPTDSVTEARSPSPSHQQKSRKGISQE